MFSHALERPNITGKKTDMTLTRRNAMRATAATASAIMLGAKEAFAVSDAAQIQRDWPRRSVDFMPLTVEPLPWGKKAVGILVFPKIVKGAPFSGPKAGRVS